MAALLTRMSMPPSSEETLSTIASTEALSETSASSAMQRPPPDDASRATRSAFSSDRSTAATAAPEAVSLEQMPSARPPPPPVTIAARPSREPATCRTSLSPSTEYGAAVEGRHRQAPSHASAPADDDTRSSEIATIRLRDSPPHPAPGGVPVSRAARLCRERVESVVGRGQRSRRWRGGKLGIPALAELLPAEIGRASCRKECRSRWSPYH